MSRAKPAFAMLVSGFTCVSLITQSFAANTCEFLPIDPNAPPSDGQSFVRAKGAWTKLESLAPLNLQNRTRIDVAYVIRLSSGNDRTGVLIVKTNRPATQTDGDQVKSLIRLVRKGVTSDPGCQPVADFPNGRAYVSTRAYEDYHDYSAPDTAALRRDEAKIKAFHFSYRSDRKGRCARTDEATYDEFPWNLNSNRAQFSFNPYVVQNGSYASYRVLFGYPPSLFDGTADNRTEMTKYATAHGIACIQFSLNLDPGSYSFRINDLEGRQLPPLNGRTPERTFPIQ
jgi:hypothetical protein